MTQPKPKFKVGDKVKMSKKTLYGETEGIVEDCYRLFRDINPGGCNTSERTIKSIRLPYEFDGETLTVHYPEMDLGSTIIKAHTEVSKFWSWSYSVRTPKMLTSYPEKYLKIIAK